MDENKQTTLSDMEIDAVGEISNISMGAAATAISTMLDAQVLITTPKVSLKKIETIDYSELEPAIAVKITYVEGLTGSNAMVFKQRDMQLILNQLMGITDPIDDKVEFEFDELSISAACEVMNQMMGASATALSELLDRPVNISPPTSVPIGGENTFQKIVGIEEDSEVVATTFNLTIEGIMESEFVSVMTWDLAKLIVGKFIDKKGEKTIEESPVAPQIQEPVKQVEQVQYVQPVQQPIAPPQPPVNVKQAQFPQFGTNVVAEPSEEFSNNNMNLLMNVPLNVSIEIGKTRKKIKEILDFTNGSIIELDKQAGAPVDIVVNGQLIAKGDVVVIDDNFGVRVTEILDAKSILNTIGYK